ncbi:ABC transporter permease subunit [uncultured Roseobacter sp.]|uniref:ABC transporter permease n=1 Tax=uncultured Roseobacter sp. TaxID=114847 RepID=UPI00263348A0|nr:ABC transporter permease subunit [uncultured Roseobacter sp.]
MIALRAGLVLAGFLLVWEGAAAALDGRFLLAGPRDILAYGQTHAALLGRALAETSRAAALGYLWGNLAALALAAIALLMPMSERLVRTLALVVFCLPLVATGPILRVLYGPGAGPQITLSALSVFYTTLIPLLAGLRATPRVWLDLVASYGRGRWSALTNVRAMAATPYLVAGLQIAAPAAFLGAMIGEFTGAERGMGVLTLRAMRSIDVDATWTLATLAAAVSMLAYAAAGQLGRLLWPGAPPVLLVAPAAPRSAPLWQRALQPLAMAGITLALWHGVMAAFDLNRFFAKRPADVWQFLTTREDARDTLLSALAETASTVGPGYLAGLAAGAGLAGLCVLLPRAAAVVLPVAVTLRAVPIVTTAPLIVLAAGRGAGGLVAIVAVMIFFPTLIACLHGLQRVPAAIVGVFDSYAAGRWRMLLDARIPSALPAFFASARMAVPAAVLAVTVAEWLATGTGTGNLMALAASTSDYNMLWSAVAALTLLAVAGHALVAWAEVAVFARYAPEQLVR